MDSDEEYVVENIPVYEFKNDIEGRFLKRFSDSILANADYPVVVYLNIVNAENRQERRVYDYDPNLLYVINWSISPETLKALKGVVRLSDDKIGLLINLSEEWLSKLHVRETNYVMKICTGASYRPTQVPGNPIRLYGIYGIEIAAVLDIGSDSKVNPLVLFCCGLPIQKDTQIADLKHAFNWIEAYYKDNWLPSDCGYYHQLETDEKSLSKGMWRIKQKLFDLLENCHIEIGDNIKQDYNISN